jgi:hypothetical protein
VRIDRPGRQQIKPEEGREGNKIFLMRGTYFERTCTEGIGKEEK